MIHKKMETPILTFGKYKEMSAKEVFAKDPSYFNFIKQKHEEPGDADSFWKSEKIENLLQWYKAQPKVTGPPVVNFGKYNGTPANELMQKDPKYVRFILSKASDPEEEDGSFWKSKRIQPLVQWLQRQPLPTENTVPKGVFLPYDGSGNRYTLEEVCSMLNSVDYDEEFFYDKEGNTWEMWKIKSLESKLRSEGLLD
jgi:hypothetical protein